MVIIMLLFSQNVLEIPLGKSLVLISVIQTKILSSIHVGDALVIHVKNPWLLLCECLKLWFWKLFDYSFENCFEYMFGIDFVNSFGKWRILWKFIMIFFVIFYYFIIFIFTYCFPIFLQFAYKFCGNLFGKSFSNSFRIFFKNFKVIVFRRLLWTFLRSLIWKFGNSFGFFCEFIRKFLWKLRYFCLGLPKEFTK